MRLDVGEFMFTLFCWPGLILFDSSGGVGYVIEDISAT